MNEYYSFFQCDIDKQKLLDLFNREKLQSTLISEKGIYHSVDPDVIIESGAPSLISIDYQLNRQDVMLSVLSTQTRLHCNPGNNGLLIVPLAGALNFDFYSYQPRIVEGRTQFSPSEESPEVFNTLVHSVRDCEMPIAFNGRLVHNYWPTTSAVFYARKIPLRFEWEQIQQMFG